jgi:hypothetical protein
LKSGWLINARHVKHVPGRTKTDVQDCQWIQKPHSFGLLNGSFVSSRSPDSQAANLYAPRLGAPKAIVAMAHHLARLVYRILRYGQNYVEKGIHQYELKFRLQRIKWLRKEAKSLNLQLVPA